MNIDTSSEYTSSSEFEFLSSTDPSEPDLSEREVKKRTDPALLAQKRNLTKSVFHGVRPPVTLSEN